MRVKCCLSNNFKSLKPKVKIALRNLFVGQNGRTVFGKLIRAERVLLVLLVEFCPLKRPLIKLLAIVDPEAYAVAFGQNYLSSFTNVRRKKSLQKHKLSQGTIT